MMAVVRAVLLALSLCLLLSSIAGDGGSKPSRRKRASVGTYDTFLGRGSPFARERKAAIIAAVSSDCELNARQPCPECGFRAKTALRRMAYGWLLQIVALKL